MTTSPQTRRPSPPPTGSKSASRRPRGKRAQAERLETARSYHGDTGDGGMMILDTEGTVIADIQPPIAHGIRELIARVYASDKGELPKSIGVTSALSGEGVSFVANALGAVLAHDLERPVCIVDLNWWSPSADRLQSDLGLADALRGATDLKRALTETSDGNLFLLDGGFTTVSERPVLASNADLGDVIVKLREDFEHVVLDLPAVLPVSETRVLAAHADAYVMVVRHGATADVQTRSALDDLSHVRNLGVVLNRSDSRLPARLLHLIAPW
ncbi:MAG: CpsD/CapB family tyrosine-protein kinase [Acidimicrobiia bacterium]